MLSGIKMFYNNEFNYNNYFVRFIDKLTINVQESTSYTVPLTAEGNGTTMVSYPPLYPCVELGTHFSCHQNTKQFVLTNKGRRTQVHTL